MEDTQQRISLDFQFDESIWYFNSDDDKLKRKGSGEMLIEYSDFVFHDSDKISEEESFAFPRKDSISSEPIPIVMPEPQNKEKIKFY